MKSKLINESPKTFVLIFETGDEVMEGLKSFAESYSITAASFKAIGAFSKAELGFYDMQRKEYEPIRIDEQVEVLSIIGDVSLLETKRIIHAHAVVGKRDGSAHGGHLLKAWVRPTLEVILIESPAYLDREMNNEVGIPLIKL